MTDEVAAVAAQTAEFVKRDIVPHGDQWEVDGKIPRQVLKKMGQIGFFGLRAPEENGGIGLGPLASVVFAEQLGRSTFGGFTATVIAHTDLAMPYLTRFGSAYLKEQYLTPMVAGELIAGIGVTEPDAGSDVAAIRTVARREADGWLINGSKMFITNGAEGDLIIVAAKTDTETKGSRGVSMFVVERETPGFEVGRALKKMGWRSSDTAELVFDDCFVPAANLIGEENRGFYYIMENFQHERLILAGQSLGEAQRALEITIEYVRSRHAFGGPLWDKQAIRHRLAMDQARIDAARQLTYHATWLEEQGKGSVRLVSEVKALVGELVNEVLYDCVQFHGGMGFIAETVVERLYRDARVQSIGGGATEIMLDEVAKGM
jgi:acyl-CoA dehydrogenase